MSTASETQCQGCLWLDLWKEKTGTLVDSTRHKLEDSIAPVLAAKQHPGLHPKGFAIRYISFLNYNGMKARKATALRMFCPYYSKIIHDTAISILNVTSSSKN